MSANVHLSDGDKILRYTLIATVLVWMTGLTCYAFGDETIKFNSEYKLKRVGSAVSVYQFSHDGDKEEYVFNDFNADLLLLLYRHIDLRQITSDLTKKYHMGETDCRRQLKMALNTFEEWDIILRNR
jgi:hypothetical protein